MSPTVLNIFTHASLVYSLSALTSKRHRFILACRSRFSQRVLVHSKDISERERHI